MSGNSRFHVAEADVRVGFEDAEQGLETSALVMGRRGRAQGQADEDQPFVLLEINWFKRVDHASSANGFDGLIHGRLPGMSWLVDVLTGVSNGMARMSSGGKEEEFFDRMNRMDGII
jgi:hypothetical protein